MISLYGVPSCNKIRDTKMILENHNIVYQFINVKKVPISKDKLNKIVDQLGIDNVVNKQGLTYKKLGLKTMNLNDNQLFQWLYKEQGMIKRPLLENDSQYLIEFDKQKIVDFCIK